MIVQRGHDEKMTLGRTKGGGGGEGVVGDLLVWEGVEDGPMTSALVAGKTNRL